MIFDISVNVINLRKVQTAYVTMNACQSEEEPEIKILNNNLGNIQNLMAKTLVSCF